eukprot:SAG31_NODE_2135_length_6364_cov_4.367438_4_plen_171_part_00
MATSCEFDPADSRRYPFMYRQLNGSVITHGVASLEHPDVCTWPAAAESCAAPRKTLHFAENGSQFQCCAGTDLVNSSGSNVFYCLIAGLGLALVLISVLSRYLSLSLSLSLSYLILSLSDFGTVQTRTAAAFCQLLVGAVLGECVANRPADRPHATAGPRPTAPHTDSER